MPEKTDYTSESRFYMWRAIFAVAHADGIVTVEETDFLARCFDEENLSSGQREILMKDLGTPRDVTTMFANISDEKDRIDFFILAQDLSASDGSYCNDERRMINSLKKENLLGFAPNVLNQKILERQATRRISG